MSDTRFEHLGNVLANATDEEVQRVLHQYMKKSKSSKEYMLKYFSDVVDCEQFDYDGQMTEGHCILLG